MLRIETMSHVASSASYSIYKAFVMFVFLKPFRFLAQALTEQASAKELALGFAIGAMVGLVPKGNLLAMGLMVILSLLRLNLGVGMASLFLFSWVGMLFDPLTHRIGQIFLTAKPLAPLWGWMANQPIIPWTSFNNTVVLGSFIMGVVLIYPLYRMSIPLFEKYGQPLAKQIQKFRFAKLLLGTEWVGRVGSA